MKRLSQWPLRLLAAASASTALGCGADFDSPSLVQSLRVLAVQKDKPYARPGDTLNLSMLLAEDPTLKEEEKRKVNVLWVAACENPLADLYQGCVDPSATPPQPTIGEGLRFSFPISSDIISRRPPPVDAKQPPYGLAVVFFAACAGTVAADTGGDFPIKCTDEDGDPVSADGFVAGYTFVYAYDGFTNANPLVTGVTLNGKKVTPECMGDACIALEEAEFGGGSPVLPVDGGAGDAAADGGTDGGAPATDGGASADGGAGSDGGTPSGSLCPGPHCVRVCTDLPDTRSEDRRTCPRYEIELVADPESAEHNTVIEARQGGTNLEQMWINYYTDHARLYSDVKLLNDATEGWNDAHEAELRGPSKPGPFKVWAVAHDNRGGAEWLRVALEAEATPD